MIKYHFTFSEIEVQFDNNAIGTIIVVNNTKYIDIPSNPRYKLYPYIIWGSWTNWNWLKEKSKKINITKETNKFKMDALKDIILAFFSLSEILNIWGVMLASTLLSNVFLEDMLAELLQNIDIKSVPNKGIKSKDKSNMYLNKRFKFTTIWFFSIT